jgi:two-component system response regulator NreC
MTEAEPAEITIVIADDHQVVRSGLRLVLHGHEGMRVVGEAGNVAEALTLVASRQPDVLVLDLNMPGERSLPAIPRVAEACARTKVVVLTMQDDPAFAREALQAGASAFVLKDSAGGELVAAVHAAAEGRTYLNPELGARLVAAGADEGPADGLTDREREVLCLIALGHTNPEIAGQLFLSVRTIETHRSHIHRKLGLGTRAELVRYAIENGLVKL